MKSHNANTNLINTWKTYNKGPKTILSLNDLYLDLGGIL